MRTLSYLEKLLDGAGVEWKTLGDIGDVRMCKRILKNETKSEGEIPFYKIGTFGKKADAFISKEVYESYKSRYSFPKKGDVLLSASGTIGRAVIYDGEPAYFQDSNIVWLDNDESIVTNKYLWHFYKVAKWFVSDGGTIDRLYNDNIQKTKIPIPCPENPKKSLEIQAEIVRILDAFTSLTAELSMRKKQYNYYRDQLLTFSDGEVEWKALRDMLVNLSAESALPRRTMLKTESALSIMARYTLGTAFLRLKLFLRSETIWLSHCAMQTRETS